MRAYPKFGGPLPSPKEPSIDRHRVPHNKATNPREISRLARLVAHGELPVPQHLNAEDLQQLVRDVQEHRRRRLVQFIARVIAQDIRESLGSEEV